MSEGPAIGSGTPDRATSEEMTAGAVITAQEAGDGPRADEPPTGDGSDRHIPQGEAHRVAPGAAPGYEAAGSKDALSRRLRRIEGQVRGVEKMVADDRYCIDVLTQIAAIQSGLKAVALGLLDDHVAHCVVDAARAGGSEQATKLAEVSEAVARLVR